MSLPDDLVWVSISEGIAASVIGIVLELHAMRLLYGKGRLMYYYHPYPLAACMVLLVASVRPFDATLHVISSQLTAILTANVHNTYYVHVVAMTAKGEVETPHLSNLVVDLFAPRHKAHFYPWGVLRELLYSVACIGHMIFRTYYAVRLLLSGIACVGLCDVTVY